MALLSGRSSPGPSNEKKKLTNSELTEDDFLRLTAKITASNKGSQQPNTCNRSISSVINWCTDIIYIPHIIVKIFKFMFQNATTDTFIASLAVQEQ